MYKGKTSKLALSKQILCAACNGVGGKKGSAKYAGASARGANERVGSRTHGGPTCTSWWPSTDRPTRQRTHRTCKACDGHGVTVQLRQVGPGMVQQIQQVCTECRGDGEVINANDRCKECKGRKVVQDKKVLEVHIDKGMADGQKVVFSGEGDQIPGVTPGDVVIVLDEQPHGTAHMTAPSRAQRRPPRTHTAERAAGPIGRPTGCPPRARACACASLWLSAVTAVFKRKGADLFAVQKIPLATALCGGQFSVTHLDDRVLIMTNPAGSVIKPGTRRRHRHRHPWARRGTGLTRLSHRAHAFRRAHPRQATSRSSRARACRTTSAPSTRATCS